MYLNVFPLKHNYIKKNQKGHQLDEQFVVNTKQYLIELLLSSRSCLWVKASCGPIIKEIDCERPADGQTNRPVI